MEQAPGGRDLEQVEEWVKAALAVVAGAREVVLRQAREVIAFALTAAKKQRIN